MTNTSPQRGFTLLLAALVSSIVLTIGAAIYNIASKQINLSGLGRDSQFAFYAADTGAECALYWDLRHNYFATSSPVDVVDPDPRCDGQSLNAQGRGSTVPYTMTFTFEPLFANQKYCTDVSVSKTLSTAGVLQTTIHSDGLSVSCADRDASARALQRSVELHY